MTEMFTLAQIMISSLVWAAQPPSGNLLVRLQVQDQHFDVRVSKKQTIEHLFRYVAGRENEKLPREVLQELSKQLSTRTAKAAKIEKVFDCRKAKAMPCPTLVGTYWGRRPAF